MKDMKTCKWWVSCSMFTVQINTINGVIVSGAPIVMTKFRKQHIDRLLLWIYKETGSRATVVELK